jgi:hypothetical protein
VLKPLLELLNSKYQEARAALSAETHVKGETMPREVLVFGDKLMAVLMHSLPPTDHGTAHTLYRWATGDPSLHRVLSLIVAVYVQLAVVETTGTMEVLEEQIREYLKDLPTQFKGVQVDLED